MVTYDAAEEIIAVLDKEDPWLSMDMYTPSKRQISATLGSSKPLSS